MVVKFEEEIINEKNGNKANFLIEMKKAGFNVPNGLVLDSDVYINTIKNIDTRIEKLISKMTVDNVKAVSKKINTLFENVKLSTELEEELNNLLDSNKKYAVRSSGTKEDLDNYSFAGQYQTFLNITSCDVSKKVISCYKSMFSETILSYLVNNNISANNLKMSVIIQEMVDADMSGICFTLNPITGNDKEMLIEVGLGLGENIVSGKVEPEQYYYNWYDESYNYDSSNKLLNKNILAEMTMIFSKIQLYFGYPCDIEFAIKNNEIYILQAREITKIKYLEIEDIWSTADFKDGGVSATICTPYMWSLYEYIWEYTLRKFILESKILKEKEISPKLGKMFYGRCYWNLSTVKKAMSKIVGYKEREFDSEYGIKINYEGDGATTKISIKSINDILRMALAQSKILKERNNNAETYKQDLLNKYYFYKKNYDNKKIKNIKKEWYELTHEVYLQSESTYFWQIFINTVHQALYKDGLLKYVNESEYLTLLGSIENISHLLPFYDMWNITREIRADKKSYEYWNKTSTDKILKNLDINKYYMSNVKELVEEYGYHSDKELDVTYPCYYEEPTSLINSIKEMIELSDEFSPIEDQKLGKEKYQQILNKLKEKISKNKYKKVETKINNMRKMLWWREEFRDISTRFYYIIRVYTLELASYLVDKKVINDKNDIWFLSVSDLWDYIDKKQTKQSLNLTIQKNKKYYNSYRNYMSENEIGNVFADSQTVISNDGIKGIGANNGIVTGVARVIESFDEIDRLEKNDILVTRFTDTGWTPKFAILSGIVTEYGGILCHAAIVSREYGIPAIVSCHNVMEKINDGDIITIDGATGIVLKKYNK